MQAREGRAMFLPRLLCSPLRKLTNSHIWIYVDNTEDPVGYPPLSSPCREHGFARMCKHPAPCAAVIRRTVWYRGGVPCAVRALCEKLAVLHHREFGKFRRLKGRH